MKCINPKMKELVSLYQFNLLRGEDKLKVEAHLLECDACFEEVYRLSPTVEIMEEMPEFFLDALQPTEAVTMRINKLIKNGVDSLMNLISGIFSTIANWWHTPVIRILVPVTALAVLLLIFISPDTKKYSDLAIIENVSSSALKLRGLYDELSPIQNLYDQGLKCYQEENYPEAIRKFSIFVKKKKNDAYGHFYLGVSLLLTEEIKKGIDHLELATKLSKKQRKNILLERCYWFLGNAYLKNNDVEKALKEFRSVVAIGGEYKENAIKQMTRIEDMRGE